MRTGRLVPGRRGAQARAVVGRRRAAPSRVVLRGARRSAGRRSSSRRPRAPRRPARAPPARPRARPGLDRRRVVGRQDERADAVLEREPASAPRSGRRAAVAAATLSSRRIADGSRPASRAASSIAALPAARSPGLEVGQARQPAVAPCARSGEHPRLVGADPDLDVVHAAPARGPRRRAGSTPRRSVAAPAGRRPRARG